MCKMSSDCGSDCSCLADVMDYSCVTPQCEVDMIYQRGQLYEDIKENFTVDKINEAIVVSAQQNTLDLDYNKPNYGSMSDLYIKLMVDELVEAPHIDLILLLACVVPNIDRLYGADYVVNRLHSLIPTKR